MDRRSPLRRLLSSHLPADDREAVFRSRMLDLVVSSEDPFSRDRFNPGHFTASAFVLAPDGGSALMLFHAKLKRWLQPGGHVEPGDADLLAAARREALEETGLERLDTVDPAILDLDIHTIPARGSDPEHAHFDLRFLLRAGSGRIEASAESEGFEWVPIARLASVDGESAMARVARKLEAFRAG